MRIGIFADIHSNLEAFRACQEDLAKQGLEGYVCLGDLVGYGANPNECIDETLATKAYCIAGNHDWVAIGKLSTRNFNPSARQAASWTAQMLGEGQRRFLEGLELVHARDNYTVVHGSLDQPELFEYIIDYDSAELCFEFLKTPLCFIGHSHVPGVFRQEVASGYISYTPQVELKIESGYRYIINVGSVGQPRDGDPRACYCIYDTEQAYVGSKRLAYDIAGAQSSIVKAGLPPYLAQRLAWGR